MESLIKFYQEQYPIVVQQLNHGLDTRFAYHGLRHTLDVIEQSEQIGLAMQCTEEQIQILKVASLFHDLGFLHVRKGHEKASSDLFLSASEHKINDIQRQQISACILATTMPQSPQNLLEQIICDADLDYLGRSDFYEISQDLFHEMHACGEMSNQKTWDEIQVVFLDKHHFHTSFNQSRRNEQKNQHLAAIKERLKG
jgi:predicted metal-dependent HD superfamily phosphohydrolase